MVSGEQQSSDVLIERLRHEVRSRQSLERELVHALRTQSALRHEITLLRKVLNARSVPDFVILTAVRRARHLAKQGPNKVAAKTLRAARRRAGVVKRRILRQGK